MDESAYEEWPEEVEDTKWFRDLRENRPDLFEIYRATKAKEIARKNVDTAWTDLGPQWRRSKEEQKIPASAKSIMRHRSACGVKLSDNDLARFWSKIDVKGANQCWPWKNSLRGSLGYGQFRIGDKICDAHRIALELKEGPLKKGRYVCHSCDSPKCCNPRHLFAGTQKNNMDDMTEKGRGDN